MDCDDLKKEIEKEMMSDEELMRMLRKFFMCHSYTDDKLTSCGACGLHEMERPEDPEVKCHRLNLDTHFQASVFKCSEEDARILVNAFQNPLNMVDIPIDTAAAALFLLSSTSSFPCWCTASSRKQKISNFKFLNGHRGISVCQSPR